MSVADERPGAAATDVRAAAALVAFAANSVLCRLALGRSAIDAASFSTIRLASGALALLALTMGRRTRPRRLAGTWRSGLLLFLYAIPFSFAYLSLEAGTGALLLFGSVQATMLLSALLTGERPRPGQWAGLTLALAGLLLLVMPGLRAPSPRGAALMILAGMSWGLYSLRGRGAADPLLETAGNFCRALVPALTTSLLGLPGLHVGGSGAAAALASGVLASGLGYVMWYAALRRLSATRAALVQLPVPILAAAGGAILLGESVSLRLIGSGILILGVPHSPWRDASA